MNIEIKRNLARGDKKVSKFSGAVRSLDSLALEEGDQFTFPNEYTIYEQKLGSNSVQYIMVELTNGNAKPFYPSTFTKSRTVCEPDGTLTSQRVHTEGTAAEEFWKYGSVQEAMDAMKGKTVKVTRIDEYNTIRFGTDEVITCQIPTIDFVNE